MKQVEAVIFDWAGTTVDYGCMAPVYAMQQAFEKHGIAVSLEEIRKPMGLAKLDHIKSVLAELDQSASDELIHSIYTQFEVTIFSTLHAHTSLIPGLLTVQDYLRECKIKIGSTTGYTSAMMDIVANEAKKQGYRPDVIVTPDEVKRGRPYPFMLQKNLMELDVRDVRQVIKVGDTIADIQEGLHAGCISVGVVHGSSMLGLDEVAIQRIDKQALQQRSTVVRHEMLAAGAHHVIDTIAELPQLFARNT